MDVLKKEFGNFFEWDVDIDFWLSKPEVAASFIDSLKKSEVKCIGHSAGKREIIAISYGDKEPLDADNMNLHSSIASNIVPPDPTEIFPKCFFGTERRKKPVVVLQGAIHGAEITGTVASLNLCNILENGVDLRGKEWPELKALAEDTRLIIIPWMNPDGTSRMPLKCNVNAPAEFMQRCTYGIAADGKKYSYPALKDFFPMPPEKTAYMGTYFNDAGVNLQYDFCMPERQPETLTWMKHYLDEKPDGVLMFHCDQGSLVTCPPSYVPLGYQHEISRLGGAMRDRLLSRGFDITRASWAGLPSQGKPILDQFSAVYLSCGAMGIICELPNCSKNGQFTPDQLLDIGLISIEATLQYAHRDGLRPYETREKMIKNSQK